MQEAFYDLQPSKTLSRLRAYTNQGIRRETISHQPTGPCDADDQAVEAFAKGQGRRTGSQAGRHFIESIKAHVLDTNEHVRIMLGFSPSLFGHISAHCHPATTMGLQQETRNSLGFNRLTYDDAKNPILNSPIPTRHKF